jgi:hypothetical protein
LNFHKKIISFNTIRMNVFIIVVILLLILCLYSHSSENKNITLVKESEIKLCTSSTDCVLDKSLYNTKYDDPDKCDIDSIIPFSENHYADALKSFGCDQYLDGAHYNYLPCESRAEYHQRWRERVRAQQIFHPSDANYC